MFEDLQGMWFHTQREAWANTSSVWSPQRNPHNLNKKIKVPLHDGDTYLFDIAAGVLYGDILARYLFLFCLDYVLRTSIDLIKENGSTLKKARSRRYADMHII